MAEMMRISNWTRARTPLPRRARQSEISRKIRRRRRRRAAEQDDRDEALTREELRAGAAMYPPVDIPRPTSRAE
jgi:hypothetical protein